MLSELEGAVLSLLSRQESLSAYAIRREFEQSPTGNWSASAGAIYPLVKRLTERGLISEARVDGDGRQTRRLSITPTGRKALTEWVGMPDPGLFGPSSDPLRTRGYALVAMPVAEQRRHLENWRQRTRATLKELQDEWDRERSQLETGIEMIHYGTLTELDARLKWITKWLERLED